MKRDELIHENPTLLKRFAAMFERGPEDACWPWAGALDGAGYPKLAVRVNGKSTKIGGHRLALLLQVGELVSTELACHRCDNPVCVNPHHLFKGSVRDNALDMVAKGRANARLTTRQVREIRRRYAAEDISQLELAKEYSVAQTTIGRIVRFETFTDLPEPAIKPLARQQQAASSQHASALAYASAD